MKIKLPNRYYSNTWIDLDHVSEVSVSKEQNTEHAPMYERGDDRTTWWFEVKITMSSGVTYKVKYEYVPVGRWQDEQGQLRLVNNLLSTLGITDYDGRC